MIVGGSIHADGSGIGIASVPPTPPGTWYSQCDSSGMHATMSEYTDMPPPPPPPYQNRSIEFRERRPKIDERRGAQRCGADEDNAVQDTHHGYRSAMVAVPAWQPTTPVGIPFGTKHRFHDETTKMGSLSEDYREFTKRAFKDRLSLVTESDIHTQGVLRYALQFAEGELSCADGLGFVFASSLPCPKNIQKIVSIFVNRAGRICMRALNEVKRSDIGVKRLELGDWVSVAVDLEGLTATFTVWPKSGARPSVASFAFGHILENLNKDLPKSRQIQAVGHFACVIKNEDVKVILGS